MQSAEIRRRFLAFFEKRGHAVIPSAPLVPQNDPSVLFNTAGMQPLVPYLLGEKHPSGALLADVQKCVRTGDLEDIGDNRHFSFFEMLGNWSLGAYFKEEAISWSYEFLTSKDEGLGLDPSRLYFTIFEGDENAPFDQESKDIWMSRGVPEQRIYALPADDNWWSPGDNGPCGPCTEMFYDMDGTVGDLPTAEAFLQAVKEERVIEIWNDVFMEYEKQAGAVVGKLSQKNVDTGAGLERITAVMQGVQTAYDTDIFADVMAFIRDKAKDWQLEKARVIADHMRTALMMTADGVLPSNKDRGYILRRLLRRSGTRAQQMGLTTADLLHVVALFRQKYAVAYPEVSAVSTNDDGSIAVELRKFNQTLTDGLKEFEKGTDPFILATTYGFPVELTLELAKEHGQTVDLADFYAKMEAHQNLSRTASAGMFKGGLANHNEKTVQLHTAHHLLLAALQEVLGPSVKQRGSNITEERLRMDFAFERKMTDDEKARVEEIVNKEIESGLSVIRREMPREEAERIGAEMEFGAKYPDTVSVYFIEDAAGNAVSKEFCGGPHVENTRELGRFKIQKEEASSQGVRRIKAVLE